MQVIFGFIGNNGQKHLQFKTGINKTINKKKNKISLVSSIVKIKLTSMR